MIKKILTFFLLFSIFSAHLIALSTHYVNTKTLKVRIAPTAKSLHLYSIYKGHQVKVYEIHSNWARISRYKSRLDEDGKVAKTATWVHKDYLTQIDTKSLQKERVKSKEVQKKQKTLRVKKVEMEEVKKPALQPRSTIVKVVAEKVIVPHEKELITEETVTEEAEFNKYDPLLEAIETSVDYEKFKHQFISHSKRLFDNGTCKLKDFKRAKGWVELADNTLYFIYCGKIKRANKIYLNVVTGEASK